MNAYRGHLTTVVGDGPEVVIKLAGHTVRVLTPDGRVHTWPSQDVRVTGISGDRFWIAFEGEIAVYAPEEPQAFMLEFLPGLKAARTVADTIAEITQHFDWSGPIGCGFPAVVQRGVVRSAANIHASWIGTNVVELFRETTSCPVYVVNDADAAGIAERHFGAGRNQAGVVLLVTVGTGLGTAVFTDGELLPNTEFGQIIIRGQIAERYASDFVRKEEDLSDRKSTRLNSSHTDISRMPSSA